MADAELQDLFDDVDTLYEDLYQDVGGGRQVLRTSIQEMEERLDKLTKRDKEMEASMTELQQQNETLQHEKRTLIRNISCLFKTAQLEIARKDRNIKELREENMRLQESVGSQPSATNGAVGTRARQQIKRAGREPSTTGLGNDTHPLKDAEGERNLENGRVTKQLSPSRIQKGVRVRFEDARYDHIPSRYQEPARQRPGDCKEYPSPRSHENGRDGSVSLRDQHSRRDPVDQNGSRKTRKVDHDAKEIATDGCKNPPRRRTSHPQQTPRHHER